MLKYLKLLTITIFLSGAIADISYVTSINSKDFQKILSIADQDTLIVVAIDNNLILPKAKMFNFMGSPYKNFIIDLIKQAPSKPYLYKPITTWFNDRQIMLVENSWPEFLNKLKSTRSRIFGLSKIDPSIYEILKDPEDKEYRELKSLGIQFTDQVTGKHLIDLASNQGRHGLFYQGIIFAGPFSISKILTEFLRVTTLMPRKIIYVDSNLNNIKQLEYHLRTFDLTFLGINYLAISQYNYLPNKEIVELQQKTLITENKWLEDDEAEAVLRKNK